MVRIEVRYCVLWAVEVTVDGTKTTVVGTTIVLVEVSVPVQLVTVVVTIEVRYSML